jgi:hypothetical protein
MGDHVLAQKQIRVPITLEIGVVAPSSRADLILVGVDYIQLGMIDGLTSYHVERVRPQHVIVVQEGNELAGCDLDGVVSGLWNPCGL